MKKYIKYIAIAILATLAFSCEQNDDIEFVSNVSSEPQIISDAALIAVNADNLEDKYTLIWEKADFGEVPTPVKYQVMLGLPGAEPEEYEELVETSTTFTEISNERFNTFALQSGLTKDVESQLNLRVLSFIGDKTNSKLTTEDLTISIIPFQEDDDVIVITPPGQPELYLVGAVQAYYGVTAWTPTEAIPMSYIGDGTTQVFEAFVKIGATDGIKFISAAADWGELEGNYGLETEGDLNGEITNNGGSSDLKPLVEGLYYVRVDIDNLTYELIKMDWGIIGDSTPGGWDGETAMTYDFAANSFKISENLVDGAMKFRSSNTGQALGGGDWDFNAGTDDETTAKDVGDGNFDISAGSYDLELAIDIRGITTISGL